MAEDESKLERLKKAVERKDLEEDAPRPSAPLDERVYEIVKSLKSK